MLWRRHVDQIREIGKILNHFQLFMTTYKKRREKGKTNQKVQFLTTQSLMLIGCYTWCLYLMYRPIICQASNQLFITNLNVQSPQFYVVHRDKEGHWSFRFVTVTIKKISCFCNYNIKEMYQICWIAICIHFCYNYFSISSMYSFRKRGSVTPSVRH